MTAALYVKESGIFLIEDLPEAVDRCGCQPCNEDYLNKCNCNHVAHYVVALASAKESAIRVEDRDVAENLIDEHFGEKARKNKPFDCFKPGIYPIPDLKWEVKYDRLPWMKPPNDAGKIYRDWGYLAVLKPSNEFKSTDSVGELKTAEEIFADKMGWDRFAHGGVMTETNHCLDAMETYASQFQARIIELETEEVRLLSLIEKAFVAGRSKMSWEQFKEETLKMAI